MHHKPTVSVVMPLYNSEKYLQETMVSVLGQTLGDMEIICINDGSTDGTFALLQSLQKKDDRIRIFSQKNQGPGCARNYGISKSCGEYIAFVDGDDFLEKDALERLCALAEEKSAEIVFFGMNIFTSEEKKFIPMQVPILSNLPNQEVFCGKQVKDSFRTFGGYACNALLRRSFLIEHGIEFLDQFVFEDDYFQNTAIASAQRICVINEPLYHYRRFSCGISSDFSKSAPQALRYLIHMRKWLLDNDKWDTFEYEYISQASECLIRNLYRINGDVQKSFYNRLRNGGLDELTLSDRPIFAYTKAFHYFEIQRIKTMTYEQFCDMNKPGLSAVKHEPELIVSLTSYPRRIATTHRAIMRILTQSEKADRIILWLTEEDFPGGEQELPHELLQLKRYGLEIEWCKNLRSYQKLIPTLRKYPDSVIVTADDDITYDIDWLKLLWESYQQNPNRIHCHRPAMLKMEDGQFSWIRSGKQFYPKSTYLHIPISHAGILYPPRSLHEDVFQEDVFLDLLPTNDELWFWVMAVRNGTKVSVVKYNIPTPKYIEGTQAVTLTQINNGADGRFDKGFKLIQNHYPEVEQRIKEEI